MKDSNTRRAGLPYDRSKKKDRRYQKLRGKGAAAPTRGYAADDLPPPPDDGELALMNQQQEEIRTDIPISDDIQYKWKAHAPFKYHEFVGLSNTSWKITPFYVEQLMRWIDLISRNPQTFLLEKFHLIAEQWEPLLKHTSAIIFFAIATQTGPLFESGGTKHGGHDKIGVMDGRSDAYKQHELKVATELFHALGAKSVEIPRMLEGSTKAGQKNLNQKKRITFAKSMALKYLGMTGKPAWDGRFPKHTRPTHDGGSATKKRKKEDASSREKSSKNTFARSSNAMENQGGLTKDGDCKDV
jgi:hypothetical protein